jgi:hypothetical protein
MRIARVAKNLQRSTGCKNFLELAVSLERDPLSVRRKKRLDPATAQSWAERVRQQRLENLATDRWSITCLPGGPALGSTGRSPKLCKLPA